MCISYCGKARLCQILWRFGSRTVHSYLKICLKYCQNPLSLYVSWNKSYCRRRQKCKGASQDHVPTPACTLMYLIKSSLVFSFQLQFQLCPCWSAAQYTDGWFPLSYLRCNHQRGYLWIFISFLGFVGAFHASHRNQTVTSWGKLLRDPCSQPHLSFFSPPHQSRDSDLHTYKTNLNTHNFRFGFNKESVPENFVPLVEQGLGQGREL